MKRSFPAANAAIVPAWLLMIVAPRWKWTQRLIRGLWIPLLLSVAYVAIVLTHIGASEGSFFSLAGVMRLFDHPMITLAGWLHYLAFDLCVGSWELVDAQRRGISHWLVVPCLLLTLMWGPAGLLCYMIIVRVRRSGAGPTPPQVPA